METSNLSTLSRCIHLIAVGLQWLPKWKDRCYRASRELCSNCLSYTKRVLLASQNTCHYILDASQSESNLH